jgi:hypothetical protein
LTKQCSSCYYSNYILFETEEAASEIEEWKSRKGKFSLLLPLHLLCSSNYETYEDNSMWNSGIYTKRGKEKTKKYRISLETTMYIGRRKPGRTTKGKKGYNCK